MQDEAANGAMSEYQVITQRDFTLSEIGQVAGELATQIVNAGSVALIGVLGAGKTSLVRAILEALASRDTVSSPTYVLEHQYSTASGLIVQHWDLYRLSAVPDELLDPVGPNVLRLIEWADKFPEVLSQCNLIIELAFGGADTDLLDSETRRLRLSRSHINQNPK